MASTINNIASPQLPLPKRNPLTGVWHEFENLKVTDLRLERSLGKGGFGSVDLVSIDGNPRRKFALKTISRKGMRLQDFKNLQREEQILGKCRSNFVAQFYRKFQNFKSVSFLMEWCSNGDLETLLERRQFFGEAPSKFYVGCVVEALQYLHAKNIVHRDLKPLNMMLDERGYVKVIDFGLSKDLSRHGRTNTMLCGTSSYMAPEVALGKMYDHSVDFWSLGVSMFQLICGTFPFDAIDIRAVSEEDYLKERQLICYPHVITWTLPAVQLIRDLLNTEATERIGYRCGIEEIKAHEWFRGFDWRSLQTRSMTPPFHPSPQVENHNEGDGDIFAGF